MYLLNRFRFANVFYKCYITLCVFKSLQHIFPKNVTLRFWSTGQRSVTYNWWWLTMSGIVRTGRDCPSPALWATTWVDWGCTRESLSPAVQWGSSRLNRCLSSTRLTWHQMWTSTLYPLTAHTKCASYPARLGQAWSHSWSVSLAGLNICEFMFTFILIFYYVKTLE